MAATKPMAQQHNSKKYGNLAQECFTDGMVDHDMHLKMSKKIAQLTKVIYALNTKNDEHEQIVKSLQQQHEKEKGQLFEETKSKLDGLRNRLGAEGELREKIRSLEQSIEVHEKQKKRLLHQFDEFKGECADHETQLTLEHNQRITALSKELQHYQQEFDTKIQTFETLISAFECDKDESIADLRKAHQIEINNLLKTQQSQSSSRELTIAQELENLKLKYAEELEQANNAYSELKTAKEGMELDYEEKFKKSKALYEKELELLKQNQSEFNADKQNALQEKIEKLNKDFQFQQAQYRHRIDGLLNDLSVSEDTINSLKTDIASLSAENANASEERLSLKSQLNSAKEEATMSLNQYREAERELQVIRQRCNDQSDQLVKKSGVIGELTVAKTQKESQIQKLTDELSDVSRKLKILQDEKNHLLSKSSSEAQQKSLEVQALEQALEDVRIEKQAQKEKYETDIAGLERILEEVKVKLERKLHDELADLQQTHAQQLRSLSSEGQQKAKDLEQRLKAQLAEEVTKLESVNSELRDRLTAEIADLQHKLKTAEQEVERMQRMVGDTSSNLGAATNELTDLRNEVSELKQELDRTTSQLNSANLKISSLKDDTEKLRLANNQMVKDHAQEIKTKLEEMNQSLEVTWLEKLQKEITQVKLDLKKQFANEKSSAINHLTDQKNEQIQQLMFESDNKMRQLMAQINELEQNLRNEKSSGDSKVDSVREKYDQQIKDLTNEIEKITREYDHKISDLSSSLEAEWSVKLKQQTEELEAQIMEARNKHIADMTSQITAHRAAVDLIKKEAEVTRESELESLQKISLQEKDAIKNELESKHKLQLESQNQTYVKQVTALKMELQRAVELRNQKEHELGQMKEDHGEKLNQQNRIIKSLESDVRKLEESINRLNAEIEHKGEEILQARSDANKQMRKQEKFLAQEHAEALERLQAHHAEETEQILAEFSKAQTILKDKIEDLSALLEEAEERYLNREPREEDMNMIDQLRRALTQREQEMQQLLADKQFYQMELVNRETNFTKVFAGGKGGPQQPQVGFINPLAKKKKGEKGPTKYSVGMGGGMDSGVSGNSSASSTGSSQRLRPIAGSPIHDERLNPNHVLPPPHAFTKKFVQ